MVTSKRIDAGWRLPRFLAPAFARPAPRDRREATRRKKSLVRRPRSPRARTVRIEVFGGGGACGAVPLVPRRRTLQGAHDSRRDQMRCSGRKNAALGASNGFGCRDYYSAAPNARFATTLPARPVRRDDAPRVLGDVRLTSSNDAERFLLLRCPSSATRTASTRRHMWKSIRSACSPSTPSARDGAATQALARSNFAIAIGPPECKRTMTHRTTPVAATAKHSLVSTGSWSTPLDVATGGQKRATGQLSLVTSSPGPETPHSARGYW